jgi:hypothetical protein
VNLRARPQVGELVLAVENASALAFGSGWVNEEGEDNLVQMGVRRFGAVVVLLLLVIAGAFLGTMAALAYMFFWAVSS